MLAVRVDAQEKVAYISRTYIKNWIGKRMASYGQVRTQLINRGVLLDANCSKNLGQGSILRRSNPAVLEGKPAGRRIWLGEPGDPYEPTNNFRRGDSVVKLKTCLQGVKTSSPPRLLTERKPHLLECRVSGPYFQTPDEANDW